MGSGLVKMVDPMEANFCGHSRDDTEPRMEGWAEVDHVVAQLSLNIESHSCGRSFHGVGGLIDG